MAAQKGRKHIERFARFRGGWGFILALSLFISAWLAANAAFQFDRENITLNLLLSIEAAFAMPVILMEQAFRSREESDRVKEVLAATHELLSAIRKMANDG